MASANPDQIEKAFAELPTQLQLSLLERLVHQVRTKIADDDGAFAKDLAAMANDPDIRLEIALIN